MRVPRWGRKGGAPVRLAGFAVAAPAAPAGRPGAWHGRSQDSGHHIGHAEPTVRFLSGRRMPRLAVPDGYRDQAGDEAKPGGR